MPIYEVFIEGKPRRIELTRVGENAFIIKIDGRSFKTEVLTDKFDLGKELQIKVDGKTYKVLLSEINKAKPFDVKVEEVTFKAEFKAPVRGPTLTPMAPATTHLVTGKTQLKQVIDGGVTAPMTGKIISVKVKKGDQVKAGQVLCILEAMKMENEITAPKAGVIREVYVSDGSSVSEGEVLFIVD